MFGQNINQNNDYPNMFNQQLQSNKWKVQSLQEALSRYSPPNSCGCYYCDIDGHEYEYEIYTDMIGQKTYRVYKRTLCENTVTQNNTELSDILKRVKNLEEALGVKPTTIEPSTTTL